MRAIVQRVMGAGVTVAGKSVGEFVGPGLVVLLGVFADDTPEDMEFMVKKLLAIRLFNNSQGKPWAASVVEVGGSLLMVSQFTLCHVWKGNKPDFHRAMKAEAAKAMFDDMVGRMKAAYAPEKICTGEFGAWMSVNLCNDGPVTVVVDSRNGKE